MFRLVQSHKNPFGYGDDDGDNFVRMAARGIHDDKEISFLQKNIPHDYESDDGEDQLADCSRSLPGVKFSNLKSCTCSIENITKCRRYTGKTCDTIDENEPTDNVIADQIVREIKSGFFQKENENNPVKTRIDKKCYRHISVNRANSDDETGTTSRRRFKIKNGVVLNLSASKKRAWSMGDVKSACKN